MIVLDVWGGQDSCEHVARFLRPLEEALILARIELLKGYLINLREEIAWGSRQEFDTRVQH